MFTAAQASEMSNKVVDVAVAEILDAVKSAAESGLNQVAVRSDGFGALPIYFTDWPIKNQRVALALRKLGYEANLEVEGVLRTLLRVEW